MCYKAKKIKGFTLVELIVVLVITTITLIAVLELYQSCIKFTMQLRQRMAQATALNFCLDRMATEITDALSSNAVLEIVSGDRENIVSGVRLTQYDSDDEKRIYRQLEWVIAADQNDGNTVYRKEFLLLDDNASDMYHPICDRIADFKIELVNGEGLEDPNATAPLMQFSVESYIDDSSDVTFLASRTFCLRRNDSLGVPDMDTLQDQLDTIAEQRKR
ncbi:MAG: type II secretion system protein [Sedimentisphaerales bacterium]|nr:type II secretion system protein [Sedimentisphaerales bacterium]MBN2842401.1 type II secretion system protein [Sedimentisphaerales bacterium]